MIITNEQFNTLSKIQEILFSITTKGEDTLAMADCVRALNQILNDINNATAKGSNKTENQEG